MFSLKFIEDSRRKLYFNLILNQHRCEQTGISLPYTLVCDFQRQCSDGSDENFCVFPPCGISQWKCPSDQCIERNQFCDGQPHCYGGADEVIDSLLEKKNNIDQILYPRFFWKCIIQVEIFRNTLQNS